MQEIEKLRLYTNADIIDTDTITAAVADNARYDIFGLVDCTLQGDSKASLKMLQGLKAEGTEPLVLLWVLAGNYAHSANALNILNRAMVLIGFYKISGFGISVKRSQKCLTTINNKALQQLIKTANHIDQSIKGMSQDNSWDLLEQLVATIAGAKLAIKH